MPENHMKRYVELSAQFRKAPKSREVIGQLHDLMRLLEKDADKASQEVLVHVYTLLAYHEKACHSYQKIYDENDRKQKARWLVMKEMAKSHGDAFAIKPRNKLVPRGKTVLETGDFTERAPDGDWKNYESDKPCVIFNRTFDHAPLKISIHRNGTLPECIGKINEYMNWLGWKCKKDLVDYYNEHMASETGEQADDEWYESLEIIGVSITVGADGTLFADISGGDGYVEDHVLDIGMTGHETRSMGYDG